MRVKQMANRITNSVLRRFGYELSSIKNAPSMHSALSRRAVSGSAIRTVIDVGASDGRWSQIAQQYFPNAFYFLIEANGVHEQGLLQFKTHNSNVDYVLAAAGDVVGEIYFDAKDPFGGLASHTPTTPDHHITVPLTTIDEQVRLRSLRPPFLLKLDTHGFEVPILKGAQASLEKTHLIVIETYNFTLTPGSLRFWEMCRYLETYGFRPIDLCDPLHRPNDQAFWQMDLFFVPAANCEFESNAYT